jgi:8-oxo-dGTP pyrophosphatase MutT (NUDIX family)
MEKPLSWKEESRRTVYTAYTFSVDEIICRSPADQLGTYTVLDTMDWAIVIPVLETPRGREFVMVRQWRHGAHEISLEFPGGVFDKGENGYQAAARELKEETGYIAGKLSKLGEFNPNPAIMCNQAHFFLAEELSPTGVQELDKDEFVNVETVAWEEVVQGMGKRPYNHALMGAALALYLPRIYGKGI